MTDPEKPGTGAESPTTARELDFDDDPPQDTSSSSAALQPDRVTSPTPKEPKKVSFSEEEAPPAKPPRPMSPNAQAEATLIEAFPSIDTKVVKAVLTASGGQVEPAFNALLGMSDPSFVAEQPPPPQPARPQRRQQPMSQLESDEMYARRLAEHYDSAQSGYGSRGRGDPAVGGRKQTGSNPNEMHEEDYSFWDDDLPEIKKNLTKGFQETQKTVNKWITDFKKRLDGDEEDDDLENPAQHGQPSGGQYQRQNFGPSQSEQLRGINRMGTQQGRRSGDRDRYDADPQVLSDDFRELQMEDNETPPRRPPRPQANPDLFKPTPAVPSGPVDEVDALYSQPSPPPGAGGQAPKQGGKKWQPLTSVAPAPVGDDNDPFSLGDSDEEEAKKTDLKPEDSERLKKSASVSEGSKAEGAPLQQADTEGSKNKEAEELLKASEEKK